MTVYTCTHNGLTQRLAVVDLDSDEGAARALSLLPPSVAYVYSDPPWNPGNATYWRTHASETPCPSYDRFLDRLVRIYVDCQRRGADHVLLEQSINPKHYGLLVDAIERNADWQLRSQGIYEVQYSRPRRPNALLHFGVDPLLTNPTGLADEPMTFRALAGVRPEPGTWIVDPCMGLGMTSRMAHYFGLNCVGTELNPARLARTVAWLEKQGYTIDVDEAA